MKSYKTEQEKFWAGEFGSNYIDRNQSKNLIASNIALFSKILSISNGISSIIEFGANIGLNLQALHALLPNTSLTAVEINDTAVKMLKQLEYTQTAS